MKTTTKRLSILGIAGLVGLFNTTCLAVNASEPAELTITDTVLRPAEKVPPLGANAWGCTGSVEWAANNFVRDSGNEPIHMRRYFRVPKCGENWFEIDGGGTSWFRLYGSGLLSGAGVRVYRLVDKEGNPLPEVKDYIDVSKADHVVLVGKGQVVPDSSPGFPDGGWIATNYSDVYPYGMLPATMGSCTDSSGVINGRTYWYTVVSIGPGGIESALSNEVSAAPKAGAARMKSDVDKPGTAPGGVKPAEKPLPPTELKAEAGDGCVKLTWKPSTSANVLGYRLKRSTAPAAEQQQRVYLAPGGPKLMPWDYVVLEKKFDNFDMKYANSRVRGSSGMMDAPDWYWRSSNPNGVSFSLVPHPQPVPKEMIDPGETCLRVDVKEGEQTIYQPVFVGTKNGADSLWYGQLEPGKHYRAEIWMRQEGLGNGGPVQFSYSGGYPDIKTVWNVTDKWQKFTYAFDGPERPGATGVFGHRLRFTGPGKLWFDNFRIFRCDKPEDADKPYVPNATVLDELIKSQPATGRKGVHRMWFLTRDVTLSSILSWHANSRVIIETAPRVVSFMDMTLPMGLTFDLATGDSPATRMRPWLVLQHILHSEQDWKNLVEYLAAPYDPKKDSPKEKPWAYLRTQQRGGVLTPWTDEFSDISIELGNETWHNGAIEDWLGFNKHGAVWQGGWEYGYFARYLIENIQSSPYWKSQKLDSKIRFVLGGGHMAYIKGDKVTGYGEEAMQNCPQALYLGHANYVGPTWETGAKALEKLDDTGFQATLLGHLANPGWQNRMNMAQAHEILARTHHAYDLVAYEGGPSGYPIPSMGRGTVQQADIAEFYGKSLAMAVAALDSWLGHYQYGWTDQAYLGYGTGKAWNSHTSLWAGFCPYPGWEALTMRNRYASGDLMKVEEKNLPTIAWDKKEYPAVGAYAMRDGKRWSVFVLSRSLTQSIPVTLNLPFQTAEKITLHTLAGDPRDSNIDQEKITLQSKDLPATTLKGGKLTIDPMPPGCIYLYVFE